MDVLTYPLDDEPEKFNYKSYVLLTRIIVYRLTVLTVSRSIK